MEFAVVGSAFFEFLAAIFPCAVDAFAFNASLEVTFGSAVGLVHVLRVAGGSDFGKDKEIILNLTNLFP
ncbi:MAG: hypothetical protein COB53_02690 [Elusimicrobia bacterium]|nr:MAG: hypothetical protein COB53_02690 [Elusimicrobiota bacterium]